MAQLNKSMLIKLIELVLAVIIFWLHYNSFQEQSHIRLFITTTTFTGFLIAIIGTFLGSVTGSPIGRTVDLYFCILGAVLYIISGSLSVEHFHGWTFKSSVTDMGIAKGALGIIQGVAFIIDGFFTFKS